MKREKDSLCSFIVLKSSIHPVQFMHPTDQGFPDLRKKILFAFVISIERRSGNSGPIDQFGDGDLFKRLFVHQVDQGNTKTLPRHLVDLAVFIIPENRIAMGVKGGYIFLSSVSF